MAADVRKPPRTGASKSRARSAALRIIASTACCTRMPNGRRASLEWWKRAFDVAAEVGAKVSGGPLGGMSVADASDPKRRDERYRGLLDAVAELSRAAAAAGLERLQVECTPLAREIPYTVEQARKFMKDLEGRCADSGETAGRYRSRAVPATLRPQGQHAGMAERTGPLHRRLPSAEHRLPERLALGLARQTRPVRRGGFRARGARSRVGRHSGVSRNHLPVRTGRRGRAREHHQLRRCTAARHYAGEKLEKRQIA